MPKSRAHQSFALFCLLTTLLSAPTIHAHGFAGKRFFPATLGIDDPAVSDEADILFGHDREPDESGTVSVTGYSFEFAKRITPRFAIAAGETWLHLDPIRGPSADGFDNLGIGAKYLLGVDPAAESIASVGVDIDLGGTGSNAIGAESFTTITPSLFFGKGFGGLSKEHRLLRPFAVTGAFGVSYPTRRSEPDQLAWGFTLQYDLHYLQSFVKDEGFGEPANHMIPIVEFPMQTCLDHGCAGQTTGTINPGVIWFNHWGQLAFEATVPMNSRTGSHLGVLLQVHFYLDDIFPHSVGKPITE